MRIVDVTLAVGVHSLKRAVAKAKLVQCSVVHSTSRRRLRSTRRNQSRAPRLIHPNRRHQD